MWLTGSSISISSSSSSSSSSTSSSRSSRSKGIKVCFLHDAIIIQFTPPPHIKCHCWIVSSITGPFGGDILNQGGKASCVTVTEVGEEAIFETLGVHNDLTSRLGLSSDFTIPPTFVLERFCCFSIRCLLETRSLWALRAWLLVGGPSGRFRPFGPAFGPSGLLTHYPTIG